MRILIAILFLSSVASAADGVPFNGILLDKDDHPITRVSTLEFRVYPSANPDDLPIWTETQVVNVIGGQLALILGDQNKFGAAVHENKGHLFLGIIIDGQPERPRFSILIP
jgi:hypothetical protein